MEWVGTVIKLLEMRREFIARGPIWIQMNMAFAHSSCGMSHDHHILGSDSELENKMLSDSLL